MFLCLLIGFQQVYPAYAQISVDSAASTSNQAGVTNAPNGVPVVDIVRPNSAGISHNKFTDYNVSTDGLILNNSKTLGTSQLGGIILGNPNLASGNQATKIINEVTSTNPSSLQGMTEVFGQSADVIVANPNGITCRGCSFTNTPKATLTTGTPQLDSTGALTNLSINRGTITIEGEGFNNSDGKAQILSRAIQVNAGIQAGEIEIISGRNDHNPQTGITTTKADDGSTKPSFAIDSSALGGMYAGKITLKGTENGVGFRLSGDMAASVNDLVITNSGKIEIKNVAAQRNIQVTTNNGHDIDIDGVVTSEGETNLNSSANINLNVDTTIESAGVNTNLTATDTITNNQAAVIASQDLNINAGNVENQEGVFLALNDVTIQGLTDGTNTGTLDNLSGSIESIAGNVEIRADTLNNIGSAQVQTDVKEYYFRFRQSTVPNNLAHGYDISPEGYAQLYDGNNTYVVAANPLLIEQTLADQGANLEDYYDAVNDRYTFEVADWLALAPNTTAEWRDILGSRSNAAIPRLAQRDIPWALYSPDEEQNAPSNGYFIATLRTDELVAGTNKSASIISQSGNINITANDITNDHSFISAAQDINLTGTTLVNTGTDLFQRVIEGVSYNNTALAFRETGWGSWIQARRDSQTRFSDVVGEVPSAITAGGNVTGNFTGDVIISAIPSSDIQELEVNGANFSIIRDEFISGNRQSAFFDNTALVVPSTNNNFKFETRFDFTDLGTFFGSEFFISRIAGDFDPEDIPRRLGDAFIDNRYINDQVLATGRKFLDNAFTSDTDQVKALLERGIAAQTDLNLSPFIALTPEQQAALTQDIVWYEERVVDGETLLVPQLYLASATLDETGSRLKSSTISAGGNLNLTADNINVTNARVNAGGNIDIDAVENLVSIGGVIDGNDINIDAGQDIILTTQKTSFGDPTVQSGTLQGRQGGTFAEGDLNVTAGNLVALVGSDASAGGDVNFSGTDVLVDTLSLERNADHTSTDGKRFISSQQANTLSSVTSGGNLNINATNSVRLRGADLSAQNDLNVTALAGDVTLDTVQNITQHSLRNGEKSNGDDFDLRHVGTSLSTTDGDVNIRTTLGDITLENTTIDSGNDINLEATTGKVELLAAVDREFSQHTSTKSNAAVVRYKHREKEDTYVRHTILTGEGNLNITAADGVTVQYRATGDLADDINQLSQAPGLAYLADLQNDPNIDFEGIREIHREFSESSTSLGPAAAAVIAIAIAVATQQYGLAAKVGTAVGGSGVTATAAGAGFSALASQAGVSLINNGGDLGAVFEELASIDTVRSVAAAALTAGLLDAAGLESAIVKDGKLDLSLATDISNQLKTVGINTLVDATISGEDLGDALKNNLQFAAVALITSQVSQEIGTAFRNNDIDRGLQLIAHAATGCAAGAIGGGSCGAVAAGQVAGELVGLAYENISEDQLTKELSELRSSGVTDPRVLEGKVFEWRARGANIAKIVGGVGAALAGGDARDVNLGAEAGANAAENNALLLLLIPAAAAVLEAVDKGIVAYDAYRLAQAIEAGDDEAAAQIAKEFAVSAGIELSIGAALPGSAVAVKLADSLKKAGLDDLASTFNAASNGVEGAGSSATRVSVKLTSEKIKNTGDFFGNTTYTSKVLDDIDRGDFHSFPESVKTFQKDGFITRLKGGDGIVREKLEIPGTYKGRKGNFEFIKEPNGEINHRLFKEIR